MRSFLTFFVLILVMCALSAVQADAPTTKTVTISQSDLGLMESTLTSGDSVDRMAILSLFKKGNHVDLYALDKNLWKPLTLAATDKEEEVRSEAVRCLGLYWIWSRGRQDQNTIDFLTSRMKEESRLVKYNALYYGLGKVKKPSRDLLELLTDEALSDHEPSYYELLVGTLKKAPKETIRAILENHAYSPTGVMRHDAALFHLYKDVLSAPPPPEWGLSNISLRYMQYAYLFSVQSANDDKPMTHSELWDRINSEFPTNIYLERFREKTAPDGKAILIVQINGNSGIKAVHAAQKEMQDIQFGPIEKFPPEIRLFYEEEMEKAKN